MKKRSVIGGLILATICMCAVTSTALAAENGSDDLTTFIDAWIEENQASAKIPGVVFSLVEGDEVLTAKGFGFSDLETQAPATENSPFRVGSVSKPVTATAALHATDQTSLTRHDDLRPLFEDLPVRPPLKDPITLHHLLTHSGGFSESLFGQHKRSQKELTNIQTYLETHLPPRFEEPGRVIAYNDHHTTLAGHAIERVSAMSFEAYAQINLFDPLGMSNSTFDQRDDRDRAISYRLSDGGFVPYPRDYILTTPAAGLITTANDMAKYMSNLLTDGADGVLLLSPENYQAQKSVQFANHPKLRGRAYGFATTTKGGHLVLYKDGQASGFAARMVLVPDLKLGFFVAINLSILGPMGAPNDAARFSKNLGDAILDRAINTAQDDPVTPPIATDIGDLSPYVGTYRNVVAARHTFEKILGMTDDVTITASEKSLHIGSGVYIPVEEGLFQWHEGDQFYIAFDTDRNNPPQYLFIGGGAYERVPWYGASANLSYILGSLVSLVLLTTVVSVTLSVRGKRNSRLGRGTHTLISGAFLARLIFLLSFGLFFYGTDPQELFFGPPQALKVILLLPVLAVVLDALSLISLTRNRQSSTLMSQGYIGLYIASALGLSLWLHYWNLLGWRF